MFLDEVDISVAAGRGGNGAVSMRREAHVPKGGPDGGNGGSGGNVVLRANANKNTLYHFRGVKHFKAENGEGGMGKLMAGKCGEDLVLEVPVGTIVEETGTAIADLSRDGETVIIARGGLGGKGNAGFKGATRQTPRFAELGEPGEERALHLTLKLVADIGIIGLPSAGKSTLISCISAARPAIADYPFTTITPNLGVVSHRGESFVVSDLPGLIKGASRGKGLGHQFLKHAERSRAFVHLVAADSKSIVTDYRSVREELRKWNPAMCEKPEIVALSKADLLNKEELAKVIHKLKPVLKKEHAHSPIPYTLHPIPLSAPIHEGLTELLDAMLQTLRAMPKETDAPLTIPIFRPHLSEKSRSCTVTRKNETHFVIDGPRIRQIAVMTDWGNHEAIARMHDVLKKLHVVNKLEELGARPGAYLEIAGKRFEWWG